MRVLLTASSMGDAPDYLAEEGLELAQCYFDLEDLDPYECFTAYQTNPDSSLSRHWIAAEKEANLVLAGNRMYDNSMITIEIEFSSCS